MPKNIPEHRLLTFCTMNWENRPLVTGEHVEIQDFMKVTNQFRGIYGVYLKLLKNRLEDHNMQPVGLGNTRILTNYA